MPHGKHGLGEMTQTSEGEGPAGRHTDPHGSVQEVWLGDAVCRTFSRSSGLACFQKGADGGTPNSFQNKSCPV